MFSSTCDSSDPVEVEPENNAATERSSSSETSSAAAPMEYELLDGDAQNDNYSIKTEDAVSNEQHEERERRTNFVVDSSWSPVVRVVNVAETGALGNTLTARVVRVVTETNDEMSVDCNRAPSQNGIQAQKPLSDAEHAAKKHVLNGLKQVRIVFSSTDNNEEHKGALTKTSDASEAKRKAESDKSDKLTTVKTERSEASKKQRKSLEAALADPPAKPVETHKSGSSATLGSAAQEQAKKRPIEGSAFDQVYEMMKKKKQKLMVNAAAGNQAPAPTQTQTQKADLKLEIRNDLKTVSKMDSEPSPTGGTTATVIGILTCTTAGNTKRRKQVRFRDENLVVLHTFDWIEDERINVSRPNFALVEGMFLRQHVSMDDAMDDETSPAIAPYSAPTSTAPSASASTGSSIATPATAKDPNWYRAPYPLDLPADFPRCIHGANSEERRAQTERERTVLAAIYFDKSSVPPSAAEPDRDSLYAAMTRQPCLIPLDDMSETHEAPSATTNGASDSAGVNGNADTDADADAAASDERHNMMQMLAALGEQLASLQQIADGAQLSRIRDVSSQVQALQTRLARAPSGAEAALIAEIARIVEPIRELCAQTAQTPNTNTNAHANANSSTNTNTNTNTNNNTGTNAPPSHSHTSVPPQRQRSWDAPRGSRWDEARNSPSYSHAPDMPPGQYSPTMDRDRRRPSSRWGPPVPSYPTQPHYSSRHYAGPPYNAGPHPYPPTNSYGPPGPPQRPPYSSYSPPHNFGRAPPHYGPPGRYNDYPGESYAPSYAMGSSRRPAFAPNGPHPHYDAGYSPHGSS